MEPNVAARSDSRTHAVVNPGTTLVRRAGQLTRTPREEAMVSGVVTAMVSVATLVPGFFMASTGRAPAAVVTGVAPEALAAIGLAIVSLAMAGAVCGFALVRQRDWAWPGAVVACALQALVGLLRFAIHEPAAGPLLAVGISSFALYYLLKLEVRAAFGRD